MKKLLKPAAFLAALILSFYIISSYDPKVLADQSLIIKLLLATLSGIFYTSFLTAPLAVILFVILAGTSNIYLITLFGGIGSVIGDLLILKFFRSIFRSFSFLRHIGSFKTVKKILKSLHLDLLGMLLGMIIIASPFPDELGLVLLGASSLSYFKLTVLTLTLNSIGILIILLTAKALL